MYKFPLVRVSGSNYDMGYQHGKICAKKIKQYLKIWTENVKAAVPNVNEEDMLELTKAFISHIEKEMPHLAEEINGMAKGAEISLVEAYVLQIRYELLYVLMAREAEGGCTSFAISGAKTADGLSLAGQNFDIPENIEDMGIVLHLIPKEGPAMLLYTSVGQIGYSGINSEGLGVFGNMLHATGWKPGVPRYLLARRMLESSSLEEAMKVIEIPRGASTNNLLMDSTRRAVDIEFTVDDVRTLEMEKDKGFFAHSNHYLHPDLVGTDQGSLTVPDSKDRIVRINKLLSEEIIKKKNKMTVEKMHEILSDHDGYPVSICRHQVEKPKPGDERIANLKTVCSLISKPEAGEIYITVGNPCENERFLYKL
jgi:isopenicillin-N N-acyltransferase-like protein